MHSAIIDVTESNVQQTILPQQGWLLLEFWTAADPQQQQLQQNLVQLAAEYGFMMRFARIESAQNPQLVQAFAVDATPTLLILKNGVVVDEVVGTVDEFTLQQFIQQVI